MVPDTLTPQYRKSNVINNQTFIYEEVSPVYFPLSEDLSPSREMHL